LLTLWDNNEEASALHSRFGEVIRADAFLSSLHWYQEVNVKELIPAYPYHNHRYDWYCKDLRAIFELHGRQHYEIVKFANIPYGQQKANFLAGRERDDSKKGWALEKGFLFFEIRFDEIKKLTALNIKELLELV
jgi:very-short-patch-repair endonuclease